MKYATFRYDTVEVENGLYSWSVNPFHESYGSYDPWSPFSMVVHYCRMYTDREHGKLLTYGSYGPYELKMASRIVRTVRFVKRIYGSWIQLFNRWKNQVVTKWSLEKFVNPYGSYGPYELNNGFTDRANRTVREKDLRIVNMVFNRLRSQVVTKWSLE